jgi:hypothetical protein
MNDEQQQPMSAADQAEYLDRLYRELDDEVFKDVAKHAKTYLPMLRRWDIACGKRMHEELAQDAICDAIEGRRRWDGKVPLGLFLKNVIRSRVDIMLKHAKKYTRASLPADTAMDESSAGDDAKEAKVVDAEPRAERFTRNVSLKDAARRLLAGIRTTAPLDLPIRRVIDAWERGHVDRADAIQASGLAPSHYDAACKRIKVIALSLPDQLVEGAVDALEVSYGA